MLLGLLKCAFRCSVYFVVVFLLLPFIPLSLDFEPVAYKVVLPEFKGPLAVNKDLDKVEYLLKDQVVGPESLEAHEGSIYTGTVGGQVIKVTGNKITPVAKFGKTCEGMWEEGICGRPLGLRFDKEGKLFIVDGYYGLNVVDVKTGVVTPLVPPGTMLDGKPLLFPNDLVLGKDGSIYFTESSTKWPLNKIMYTIMEHESSGRLLKYDPKTKRTYILLEDLHCPNGIELSHDGQSLLFSETTERRVLRYHISGPHKGDLETFADNLPGEVDNIRRSARGGYWLAFASGRSLGNEGLGDRLAPYPLVRKSVVRLLHLLGSALKYLSTFVDYVPLREVAATIDNGWILYSALPRYGLVVELDGQGHIVRSLHSPGKKIALISEVLEHNGNLYLGSFRNRFLGRVKA